MNATARSNIRIYPADLAEVPTLSNLNVTAGAPPTPNKVDTKLSPDGKIRVFNQFGSVNIFIDIVDYYTNSTLKELSQRVAALEAGVAALETTTAILDAAQPFTVVSDTIEVVNALSIPTEIRSVTVTAPVDGQVATIATGSMFEGTDGQLVICGVMDSISEPPRGELLFWQSPTEANTAHVSGSRVFNMTAGQTATYYLTCQNNNGGTSLIESPRLTAIFTPA